MTKLVVDSSLINWPVQTSPNIKESKTKQYNQQQQNPQTSCKADNFIQTSLKGNQDWKKHLNNQCLCKYCTCTKHMCKLHRFKPLGKHAQSNYKANYKKLERIQTTPSRFEQPYSPVKEVVKQSTYHNDYQIKNNLNKNLSLNANISARQQKVDNLKVGGPFFVGTTYKQEYYPKVSTNLQEIRMLNNNIFGMNVPLKAQSSYHDNYKAHQFIPTQPFRPNPCIKKTLSLDYSKTTTYNDQFKLPSIDLYKNRNQNTNQKNKNQDKLDHINKKSEYQSSFQPNTLNVCPAIVQQKKMHGIQE